MRRWRNILYGTSLLVRVQYRSELQQLYAYSTVLYSSGTTMSVTCTCHKYHKLARFFVRTRHFHFLNCHYWHDASVQLWMAGVDPRQDPAKHMLQVTVLLFIEIFESTTGTFRKANFSKRKKGCKCMFTLNKFNYLRATPTHGVNPLNPLKFGKVCTMEKYINWCTRVQRGSGEKKWKSL